jgi:hypothetical protein
MTPKEKAKDLYDSYWYCLLQSNIEKRNYWSQQCALIAVDEILNTIEYSSQADELSKVNYWQEVKQEIELL